MISEEDINCCKNEARKYIKDMEELGDNAGWVRLLLWYINELENKTKEQGKGQQSLIQSRRKWKRRYYKMKRKNKELQKAVEQIYDDYQDIGKIVFDYGDKIEELETKIKKYELEIIPQLQGELLVSKQVHEYDEQMIDTVKRKSSTTI